MCRDSLYRGFVTQGFVYVTGGVPQGAKETRKFEIRFLVESRWIETRRTRIVTGYQSYEHARRESEQWGTR